MSRAVEVFTAEFEHAHGRAPRGRGCWGFFFVRGGAVCLDARWAPGEQSFGEARRWAVGQARSEGCDGVVVAS